MAKTRNVVSQIKKATRQKFSAEEKIRIVLEGLRGKIPVEAVVPFLQDAVHLQPAEIHGPGNPGDFLPLGP